MVIFGHFLAVLTNFSLKPAGFLTDFGQNGQKWSKMAIFAIFDHFCDFRQKVSKTSRF